MNRRNFFRGVLTAGAGFMVLPGAGRVWRAVTPELVLLCLDRELLWPTPHVGTVIFDFGKASYEIVRCAESGEVCHGIEMQNPLLNKWWARRIT